MSRPNDAPDSRKDRLAAAGDQPVPVSGEEETERLALYAGYSVVCGILATLGVGMVNAGIVAYGFKWLSPIPVPDGFWRIAGFLSCACIILTGYGGMICGVMGAGRHNSHNRGLGVIGVVLGAINFLAGTLLMFAFSFE